MNIDKLLNGLDYKARMDYIMNNCKKYIPTDNKIKRIHLDIGPLPEDKGKDGIIPMCMLKFREMNYTSTGMDIDKKRLSICKEYGFNTKWGDANNKLDFENECFDVVTLFSVVEHIKNKYQLISEVKRILKKRGIVLVQIPNSYFLVDLHFSLPFWGYFPKKVRKMYVDFCYKEKNPVKMFTCKVSKRELLKLFKDFELIFFKKYIYPKEVLPKKFRGIYKLFRFFKLGKIFPMGYIFIFEKK